MCNTCNIGYDPLKIVTIESPELGRFVKFIKITGDASIHEVYITKNQWHELTSSKFQGKLSGSSRQLVDIAHSYWSKERNIRDMTAWEKLDDFITVEISLNEDQCGLFKLCYRIKVTPNKDKEIEDATNKVISKSRGYVFLSYSEMFHLHSCVACDNCIDKDRIEALKFVIKKFDDMKISG